MIFVSEIIYVSIMKQEKAKDEDAKSIIDVISQVQLLEKQLDSLKLEECLGADLIATLSDPQGTRLK